MNYFWISGNAIGLTKEALKELGVIWQFLPRVTDGESVRRGQGIATIQTSTTLKSLVSPKDGYIASFNDEAVARPNCIKENTVLFFFSEKNALPGV